MTRALMEWLEDRRLEANEMQAHATNDGDRNDYCGQAVAYRRVASYLRTHGFDAEGREVTAGKEINRG